ncbi:MAG: hypothetical protein JWR18_1898 [Segetibacter sp.]|jgi:hypothetical protein|nr:hypothetical protein [Segetibacter sp.]
MLLELIARYYKLLWLAFAAIGFLKIILSYSFHGTLEGVNGILYALFKWYGEEEQEMEDLGPRRTMMRVHNMITLLLYGMLLIILVATFIPKIFGR